MADVGAFRLIVDNPVQRRAAQVRLPSDPNDETSQRSWQDIDLPITEIVDRLRIMISQQGDAISLLSAAMRNLASELPNSAGARAQELLFTQTERIDGSLSSVAQQVTRLRVDLNTLDDEKAEANALDLLTTRVRENASGLTAQSSRTTSLESRIASLEGTVAEATALRALTTRVEMNEDGIESTANDVTQLRSSLGEQVSRLTFEVTDAQRQDFVDAMVVGQVFFAGPSGDLESRLIQTVEVDMNRFVVGITSAADWPGSGSLLINLTEMGTPVRFATLEDAAADVDMAGEWHVENLGSVSRALSEALRALRTRVTQNERGIEAVSTDVTALQSAVMGLGTSKADASAVTALATRVTANEDGITAQSDRTTRLETRVTGLDGSKADADALTGALTRVEANEEGISANADAITALGARVDGKADTSAVTALTARVTVAEGDIDAESARIDRLTASVEGKADVSALDAVSARVTENDEGVEANGIAVTQLRSSLGDRLDTLTFQVPSGRLDDFIAAVVPGSILRAGVTGDLGQFRVQTVQRAGTRFTVEVTA